MSGTKQVRGREPREWLPASLRQPARTRAGLFVAVVLSVMAGLLAMHGLSSGHSGHAATAMGHQHGYGHTHTGDHHGVTAQSGGDVGAVMAAEVLAVGDATMTGPGEGQNEPVGHGLCPGASPGHCPALPALMSMCQAVLSGAGAALLLFLLMLAVLASGPGLGRVWRTEVTPAGRDRWHRVRYRLRFNSPSLHELCISRT